MVESTLKLFPGREQYQLGDPEITTVLFDYVGRNLRCSFCFSYRHLPSQCLRPKPAFFSAPGLIVDKVPAVQGKPALRREGNTAPLEGQHSQGLRYGSSGFTNKTAGGEPPSTRRRYRPRQRSANWRNQQRELNEGNSTDNATEGGPSAPVGADHVEGEELRTPARPVAAFGEPSADTGILGWGPRVARAGLICNTRKVKTVGVKAVRERLSSTCHTSRWNHLRRQTHTRQVMRLERSLVRNWLLKYTTGTPVRGCDLIIH